MDEIGNYHTSPIFDNGVRLLSDTTIEYLLNETVFDLIKDVETLLQYEVFYDEEIKKQSETKLVLSNGQISILV